MRLLVALATASRMRSTSSNSFSRAAPAAEEPATAARTNGFWRHLPHLAVQVASLVLLPSADHLTVTNLGTASAPAHTTAS